MCYNVVNAIIKVVSVVVMCLCATCAVLVRADDSELQAKAIASTPSMNGDLYKCEDLVTVVNHLRSLGKEKAIHELREFVKRKRFQGDGRDLGVFLVCRCLFANPEG